MRALVLKTTQAAFDRLHKIAEVHGKYKTLTRVELDNLLHDHSVLIAQLEDVGEMARVSLDRRSPESG